MPPEKPEERLKEDALLRKDRRIAKLDHQLQSKDAQLADKNERIHALEQRVVDRRRRLAELEAIRRHEHETETVLVQALCDVHDHPSSARDIVTKALATYVKRLGPRPQAGAVPEAGFVCGPSDVDEGQTQSDERATEETVISLLTTVLKTVLEIAEDILK